MSRKKQLSQKQLAVMNDLFAGELDEQAVLEKHKVSRNIYNKWQCDEEFVAEFDRRIAVLNRQSQLIIARYASFAVAKLVQLTESEKEETAHKGCLDIISLPKLAVGKKEQADKMEKDSQTQVQQLSTETAGRLLAVLAEDRGR